MPVPVPVPLQEMEMFARDPIREHGAEIIPEVIWSGTPWR